MRRVEETIVKRLPRVPPPMTPARDRSAPGLMEITSNESFEEGDVWDSSGSAANVAATMSNASLPVRIVYLQPFYIRISGDQLLNSLRSFTTATNHKHMWIEVQRRGSYYRRALIGAQ